MGGGGGRGVKWLPGGTEGYQLPPKECRGGTVDD